jgi:alpha/beta superfamily hydrolase
MNLIDMGKYSLRGLVVVAALLAGAACQKTHNGTEPGLTPQRGELLQTPPKLVAAFAPAALSALLNTSPLGQVLLQLAYTPLCTITVYQLEYQTVDPASNLTPASGVLMVPSGGSSCGGGRPIVLYAHGTATDRNYNIADLTAGDNDEGVILAAVFAAEGYIVVAPNYVGYDTSTLNYHPYLNADQQSKDMMDALTAGRSALKLLSPATSTTDGGKLFVTGYSQGGYVAMAAHRAMQANGIAVTASAPMSGPYALSAFADAVFAGQVNLSAVTNVALLAESYQHAYGNIYASTTDLFAQPYATGIDTLLPSTISLGQLESENKLPSALFSSTPPDPSLAGFTPAVSPQNLASVFAQGFGAAFLVTNSYRSSYLQDAAANPDGAFPTQTSGLPPANPGNAFRQDLKMNDLRTWAPAAPLLLCGGGSDPTVFFFNTQLMQSYWTATAPSAPFTVLDVNSAAAANDPYGNLKSAFAAAETLVRINAVAGGAKDNGDSAVFTIYHAGLVPPFCLSAAKSFFDAH